MKKIISFIIAVALYIVGFIFVISQTIQTKLDFSMYLEYKNLLIKGWGRTIQLSIMAILLSLVVGLILYFMSIVQIKFVNYLAAIHKTIIFGTPLIVLAILSYYYIGTAIGITNKMTIGVLTLALYIGAYISDIYKGAIESIHINQWQTAKMFGFTKYQTYRFIIFPQILKSILPPLAGQFALTVKGSALLSYMGLNEYLNEIGVVQAISYDYLEGYMILSIGYWLITIPIIVYIRRLEEKLHLRIIK